MAITTYPELKAAVATWLIRSDLTARIPEFIALAEARLNRVLRKRQAESDQSLTTTASSRTVALPATFAEALQCWILVDGERRRLVPMSPVFNDASAVAGQPDYWGIDGTNLVFERPCDTAYSIVLRQIGKYALSDASPTNALLTEAPDVYLYATLVEAAPFLRDGVMANSYEAKLTRALNDLNAKDGRARSRQRLRTELHGLVGRRGFDILAGD